MSGQGAYLQLIARDIQDTMTTIQPQMTYFKSVYRGYTPFAREVHEMSIYGDADYGKLFSARVDRYGDLLGDTYLRIRTTHFNDQGTTSVPQGGSILFSEGDSLSIPENTLTIGTGDFTVEFWMFMTGMSTVPSAQCAFFFSGSGLDNFGLTIDTVGQLRIFYPGGGIILIGAPISGYLNTWKHIALVRNGTDLRLFIDGSNYGGTIAGFNYNIFQPNPFYIGGTPSAWFAGNITNFRYVSGTAVYWATPFTVPTAPLSVIPGTQLLLLATYSTSLLTDTSGTSTPTGSGVVWSALTPFPNINVNNILCRFALQLLDYIEIKIGETIIDRQYGRWMDIWSQLVMPLSQYRVYDNMVSGRYWQNNTLPLSGGYDGNSIFYIPLMFWYTHNPGLFLPLIGLQYHEVFFNIKFRSRNEIVVSSPSPFLANLLIPDIEEVSVLGNYYLLDTYERRQFALMPKMEYLIFSTQRIGTIDIEEGNSNIDLTPFFHPITEIVVACKEKSAMPFDYHQTGSGTGTDTLTSMLLQFNGNDRFKRRESTYFRCVQPYQFFPNSIGKQNQLDTSVPYVIDYPKGGFYLYSFSLNPEKWWQPSGSANFSAFDTVTLDIKSQQISDLELDIWARNYNILLITAGMGGLVYANTFN